MRGALLLLASSMLLTRWVVDSPRSGPGALLMQVATERPRGRVSGVEGVAASRFLATFHRLLESPFHIFLHHQHGRPQEAACVQHVRHWLPDSLRFLS